jgi:DNA-directed RNA polymerase specialized sigma24 family protein
MTGTPSRTPLRHVCTLLDTVALAEVSDGQLLSRFVQQREERAFTALVQRHGPMVLAVARRLLRQPQDAEDVFQAAFLLLARQAGSIRRPDSVACWLHGVAHRLALKARRQMARRQTHERQAAARHPETIPAAAA